MYISDRCSPPNMVLATTSNVRTIVDVTMACANAHRSVEGVVTSVLEQSRRNPGMVVDSDSTDALPRLATLQDPGLFGALGIIPSSNLGEWPARRDSNARPLPSEGSTLSS